MKLFGFDLGGNLPSATPDQIRQQLFAAAGKRDAKALTTLWNRHREIILQHFPAWRKIPDDLKSDRARMQAYGDSLIFMAHHIASIGDPALLQILLAPPPGKENPIDRWSKDFREAERLSDAGDFAASTRLLLDVLHSMDEQAFGPISLTPALYGLLGTNAFAMEDHASARSYYERALSSSRELDDREGVRVYLENLQLLAAAAGQADTNRPDGQGNIRTRLIQAQDLSDSARYHESNSLLHELETELDTAAANDKDAWYGKILGLTGLNFFRIGQIDEARRYTALAIRQCQKTGDRDGVLVYSENLENLPEKNSVTTESPL